MMINRRVMMLLILLVTFTLVACTTPNTENQEPLEEDEVELMLIDGTETLNAKTLWDKKDVSNTYNLKLDQDDYIVLEEKSAQAMYESIPIEVKHFEELVLTWNVKQVLDARISFLVSIGDGTNFGDFLIMGLFRDGQNMSFSKNDDPYAKVSIDTLINKAPETYNYVKFRISILPANANDLKLQNLSVTTKRVGSGLVYDPSKLKNKTIDVLPMQQLSIPNIGNIICSPTSVAMVLNHYGYAYTQEAVAKKVLDTSSNIYGNWSFNASYAGTLDGLTSRVEYIDNFDQVIDYILNDVPVIFSVTTTSLNQLDGSIMAFPAGHLIVLKGFIEVDGVWYGVFNDPAEYEDSKVERHYKLDQVLSVWKQYTYIITDSYVL